MHWSIAFVALVYIISFIIGVIGNSWVLASLFRARFVPTRRHVDNRRRQLLRNRSVVSRTNDRLQLYIIALSAADLLALLTIPFSLAYLTMGSWIFGDIICRLHSCFDSICKMLSVVILVLMSIERYVIVCTQNQFIHQSNGVNRRNYLSTTLLPIIAVVLIVIVPVAPYVYHSTTMTILLSTIDDEHNQTDSQVLVVCSSNIPEPLFAITVNYMFVVGFAIPLVIMTICYLKLFRHVKKIIRERQQTQDNISVNRRTQDPPLYIWQMTKSIWRVAIFHFVCWAPFWLFVIVPTVVDRIGESIDASIEFVMIGRMIANTLPCVNAAGNWVLYALLNRDVRMHISSGRGS